MKTYAGIPEENATLENSKVMLVTVPYDRSMKQPDLGLLPFCKYFQ